jgi:predicted phosphodiesterase
MPTDDRIRIAAVSDLHYTKGCRGTCQEIFAQASNEADVLLLCGNLTDYGLPEEAQMLAADLHSHTRILVIAVWACRTGSNTSRPGNS